MENKQLSFAKGIKDGLPICIGYFSVSFSFGILCANSDIHPVIAALISLTNVTSAGQFAGLTVILAKATLLELILTQLVINSRYALMSLTLTQKIASDVPIWKRMLIAFANTDEIFAVAMHNQGLIPPIYMAGLELTPILGWTAGTFAGAIASSLLPENIRSALGIALYGMFVAIVVPVAKEEKSVLWVCIAAICLSLLLAYVPFLSWISPGFQIIIATLAASVFGALLFPVKDDDQGNAE
ncbi:MAG: AzlC family ABC transporter permease [Lachnospiraceae bacterium]|nr:AzlC family ABC transporter permease [Lachnospiraceae bacterium]